MISWNTLILNHLHFYNNDIWKLLLIKQEKWTEKKVKKNECGLQNQLRSSKSGEVYLPNFYDGGYCENSYHCTKNEVFPLRISLVHRPILDIWHYLKYSCAVVSKCNIKHMPGSTNFFYVVKSRKSKIMKILPKYDLQTLKYWK